MTRTILGSLFILLLATEPMLLSQSKGASIKLHHGQVVAAKQVKLSDSSVGAGVLVGGTLGRMSASGKSSSKKFRNTMIGVVAGGALAGAGRDHRGMQYTVRTMGGPEIVLLTDQLEIRVGDCVVVEETKSSANIRREPDALCQMDDMGDWPEVEEELLEEAEECQKAKDRLLNAETDEEVNRAIRIVDIFCNG